MAEWEAEGLAVRCPPRRLRPCVAVGDEGWRFVEVGIIGQCMMICCDCTVGVEMEGVEGWNGNAGAGIGVLWCQGCGERRLGCGVDDGSHALVANVAFDLVVDV